MADFYTKRPAKLFTATCEGKEFHVAGTTDGNIDLATGRRTFLLNLSEAEDLVTALKGAIKDVRTNT